VPIVSSVARELFTRVPQEIQDGSYALGSTQWETTRRVTIPYVGPGLLAASVLGLGRALGEAIAVTQVIGTTAGIQWSFFHTGDTLASRIAGQYEGAVSNLHVSSLAYLAKLPVNALKIDRSFVATMTINPHSMTLVSTIISLAHALDLKVIAEGVESEDQAKLLRLIKCDEMQGYLFSMPLPADRVVAFLRRADIPR